MCYNITFVSGKTIGEATMKESLCCLVSAEFKTDTLQHANLATSEEEEKIHLTCANYKNSITSTVDKHVL